MVKCVTSGAAGCFCRTVNVSAEESVSKGEKSSVVTEEQHQVRDEKTTLCDIKTLCMRTLQQVVLNKETEVGLILNELVFWIRGFNKGLLQQTVFSLQETTSVLI